MARLSILNLLLRSLLDESGDILVYPLHEEFYDLIYFRRSKIQKPQIFDRNKTVAHRRKSEIESSQLHFEFLAIQGYLNENPNHPGIIGCCCTLQYFSIHRHHLLL